MSISWNPVDCSTLGSSVHGISQARILEWIAISFSRGSCQPRDQSHISCISCTAGGFLTDWATREANTPYSNVNCSHHVIRYIKDLLILQLEVGTFWPTSSNFPTPLPVSSNHKSDLFFSMSLSVSQAQLTSNTMLVPGAHHSDSIFLYISKWSPPEM